MNLPNTLTLSRIFLVPLLIAALFSTRIPNHEIYATAIFLAAALTDLLDGYLARRRGQVTTLGVLLDPIADKLLITAAFISLVQVEPLWVPAWMVVIIVGREFAVSGLRGIAATQGFAIAANELGKLKTVLQVIAITVIILGHRYGVVAIAGWRINLQMLGWIGLWLVVIFALLSAFTYFRKFWQRVDDSVKRQRRLAGLANVEPGLGTQSLGAGGRGVEPGA